MKTGITLATLTSTLATLLIVSAAALPVLTVSSPQSYANYQLNATFRTFQNCSASPSNYSGVACGTTSFQAYVYVNDDGQCFSGDQNCRFSPDNVTISVGGFVVWQNYGRLNHTVTSDSALYPINLFLRGGSYNYNQTSFSTAGTFKYHDSQYPWLSGTVIITQPVAPPPRVQVCNVTGPIGWTVVGLDSETALLSISHQLKAYDATASPPKLLFSESGVIQDSIELSTREESVDITRVLSALPYQYCAYGYSIPIGYIGPPYVITGGGSSGPPTFSTGGPTIASYYPFFYTPPKLYTIWWVNGPLSLGTTIEVQSLTGSATGSETLNLGGSLGSRDAWIVGSQFKEQYSQPPPSITPGSTYPSYFVVNQSIATSERFDYGKQSDILLKSSDTTDQLFQSAYLYPPGSSLYGGYYPYPYPYPGPIWNGGGIPLHETVTVTRTQDTSISIALNLVSSNINLGKNANPPPSSGGSSSPVQSGIMPMLYTATGIAASAIVAGAVWLALRARRRTQPRTITPIQLKTETATEPAPSTPS